jgi:hypothetical protein
MNHAAAPAASVVHAPPRALDVTWWRMNHTLPEGQEGGACTSAAGMKANGAADQS